MKMRIQKSLKLAVNILLHSKLRSWLTIIGIVIGVAAVIAIVSIGVGARISIQQRLGGLGADIISVSPGFNRASGGFRGGGGGFGEGDSTTSQKNLTSQDIQVIKNIPGVIFVDGMISGRTDVSYLAETASLNIEGVDPLAWRNMVTTSLASGRYLDPTDTNAIVVGNSVVQRTFKQPLALNRMVSINGTEFKIVGILASSGSFGGDDNRIFMTVNDARRVLNRNSQTNYDSISFKVSDSTQATQIANETTQRLLISRHETSQKQDFTVTSAEAIQQNIASVTQTFTIFLAAIAAVSLIVGAVGVANTLFTSVLEKTKEIGIMKAVGAKNSDIMVIFLLNSGLVGFVGGILGVSLGALISTLLPSFIGRIGGLSGPGGLTTVVPLSLVIGALIGSIIIGMIAGAIPAYNASKLKPVDALRYE